MNRVCDDHEPITMVRDTDQAVVIVMREELKAGEETAYLRCGHHNAKRLLETLNQAMAVPNR